MHDHDTSSANRTSRTIRNTLTAAAGAVLLSMAAGCGSNAGAPTQEEVSDAQGRVSVGVTAANVARTAVQVLGVFPTYTCSGSRRLFVDDAARRVAVDQPCMTITTDSTDASRDTVTLSFPENGCSVHGHALRGSLVYHFSGGTDRFTTETDFRGLRVDDGEIPAQTGMEICGGEGRFWLLAEGRIPGRPELSYRVDGSVGLRLGVPIIGNTTLVLNGYGQVAGADGRDRIELTQLNYDVGDLAPRAGSLRVETSNGHSFLATFNGETPIVGNVEIVIDGHEPVTVPIIH